MNQTKNIDEIDDIDHLRLIIKEQQAEIFQLTAIIDTLPGSIYWKDKEGVYKGRNKTSAQSLKNMNFPWRTEEVLGKTDYDLFPKKMADGFRKHDLEIMETGKESSKEEISTLATGETIIQLSNKRPLFDENNDIVGIVGNTVDITYLKNIEEELRAAKDTAEHSNNIKAEFIQNMEHDIRTPFNGVWGLANQLYQIETDAFKKELLGDITNCAKELLDYCNGILDFSKVESGTLAILEKKFDFKALINSVVDIEKPPVKLKKLELIFDYDNAIPTIIIGDDYRFQRILINLLSNAVKFTQQGYIKLRTQLLGYKSDNEIIIQLTLEDTGIGIPAEKQDFIYEKFARLNPANKGIYKGIGVGLRIVKQFVEEMGGEIELSSAVGQGTTFICTLPFRLPLLNNVI